MIPRRSQKRSRRHRLTSAACGPLYAPATCEVAVDDGGLAAQSLVEPELERAPQILEPVCFPRATGVAAACGGQRPARAVPARRRARAPFRRPRAPRDVGGEQPATGLVGVRRDELRPGGLRLEHIDRLGDALLAAGSPSRWKTLPSRVRARPAASARLLAVQVEGLAECLPGLLQSALLLGRVAQRSSSDARAGSSGGARSSARASCRSARSTSSASARSPPARGSAPLRLKLIGVLARLRPAELERRW